MRPLPTWMIILALISGAAACIYAHFADLRRDRPADWDPYRWRVWMDRQSFWLGMPPWLSEILRRGTQVTLRKRTARRRVGQPVLEYAADRLEAALDRNDGRMI